jgi:hypothetical protein
MANANAPRGFVPVRGVNSQYVTGGLRAYVHDSGDSTAVFVGDPVKLSGTSSSINGVVMPNVVQAATGNVIVGVVVGVLPDLSTSLSYVAASTTRILLVDDDPNTLYEIQQVSGGTPLTANDVGLNVNFVVAAGSTYTGLSGVTLDNTTEATTNTLDLKIVDIVNRADNDVGTAMGTGADASRFLVRINRHQYVNQVAGV